MLAHITDNDVYKFDVLKMQELCFTSRRQPDYIAEH